MLVQVSFAFTNISWFLSRMSCIFCVIKILVFFYMRFSRYNMNASAFNGLKWTRTTDLTLIRRAL